MLKTILIFCLLAFSTAQAENFALSEASATRALTGTYATPILVDADTTLTGKFFALFADNAAVTYSAMLNDSTEISSSTIPGEAYRFGTFISVTWESGGTLWVYPLN